MALTDIQYRDIMDEYDQLRRDNYILGQKRLEEIYEKIPAIKEIDDSISSQSLALARKLIYAPDEEAKAALHTRIEASSRKKRELLISHGYEPAYLDPIYKCSYCKDTGYVGNQKCLCFESKILDHMYKQSNLMDSMAENDFDHFCINYYSDQVPEGYAMSPRANILQVKDKCHDFIRSMNENEGRNLLFHGTPGVGKTFLSTCIAAEVIKAGKSVVYYTSYQLFKMLADYTFRRDEHPFDIFGEIMDADLLIIDDLGTELNNAFVNSQLFLCINERILNKKSTIISTNFTLKQINATYTERISSRLIQFYTFLHIYGDDIRINKVISSIDE